MQSLQKQSTGWDGTLVDVEVRIQLAADEFQRTLDTPDHRSCRALARAWEVPYFRLYSRINGKKARSNNGGHRTLLKPASELALLAWANFRLQGGNSITPGEVMHSANKLLRLHPDSAHKLATRRWATDFMARHAKLFKKRRTTTRSVWRKASQDKEDYWAWYESLWETMQRLGVDKKWENLHNYDETGFRIGCYQGSWQWFYTDLLKLYEADPDNRESATLCESVSAAGLTIPPFVILKGVSILTKLVANDLEEDTILATSPNGWINDQIALEWLDHFIAHTTPAEPNDWRLLLVDNHGSHLTTEFFLKATAAKIEIFPLPAHSTHKLQPLDVGVFQSYKHFHQNHLRREIAWGNFSYDRTDFLSGLNIMRRRAFKNQ